MCDIFTFNSLFVICYSLNVGNGYGLSLEALVELELDLLQRDTPRALLQSVQQALDSKSNIRKVQKALFGLRRFMEVCACTCVCVLVIIVAYLCADCGSLLVILVCCVRRSSWIASVAAPQEG